MADLFRKTGGPPPGGGDWIGWKPRSVEETVDAGVHPVVAKMRMGTFGLAKNPDGIDLRAMPWDKGREWSHGKEVQPGGYTYNRRNNAASLGGDDTDPKRQLERLSAQGVNPQDYLKMAKQLGVHPEEGVLGKSADVSLPTSKDLRRGKGDKSKKKHTKKKDKKKKGDKKSKKKAGKKRKKKGSSSSSSEESSSAEESGKSGNSGKKAGKTRKKKGSSSSAEESSKSGKSGSRGKRQKGAEASEAEESDAGDKSCSRQADTGDDGAVHMEGSAGSLWLTRGERCRRGWRDVGAPENAVMLEPTQPAVVVAAVSTDRWEDGGQAGLYAIADALWWVKLVVEATGDGCRVVFAEQHMGAPFVRGAVALKRPAVAIGLALSISGSNASAEWRDEAGTWRPVTRGTGWREAAEQQGSERPADPLSPLHFGSLAGDDEKSSERAACRLPLGWKAALMTESWPGTDRSRVKFSEVAAVPAPEGEAGGPTEAAPAAGGGELEF